MKSIQQLVGSENVDYSSKVLSKKLMSWCQKSRNVLQFPSEGMSNHAYKLRDVCIYPEGGKIQMILD